MPLPLVLRILLPLCVPPALSFVLRFVNAVIAPDLVEELDLDASTLGLLTSGFFVGFACAQLPIGLCLDRFDPRRVALVLHGIGAGGTILFGLGHDVATLMLGRVLMGVGMSGSVMTGLKLATLWFPRRNLPQLTALLFAMTGIGGMLGTVPMAALLQAIDWRHAFLGLAAAAGAVGLMIFLVVPAAARSVSNPPGFGTQVGELLRLYRTRTFWRFSVVSLTTLGMMGAYPSLWTAIWLRDVAGYDRAGQAAGLFALLAATVAGHFVFASTLRLLERRGVPGERVVAVGLVLFLAVQAVLILNPADAAVPLWCLLGALGACPIALYALLSQTVPVELSARATTAMNLLVFFASFAFQWGVGVVIDQFPVAPGGGYDPRAHQVAIGILLSLQTLAVVWFLWAGRTNPKEVQQK